MSYQQFYETVQREEEWLEDMANCKATIKEKGLENDSRSDIPSTEAPF